MYLYVYLNIQKTKPIKEWIVVDYRYLSTELSGRSNFRQNLLKFDFQLLATQMNGWVEEYFHPDFNYKYQNNLARIIRRSSAYKKEPICIISSNLYYEYVCPQICTLEFLFQKVSFTAPQIIIVKKRKDNKEKKDTNIYLDLSNVPPS